MKFKDGDVICLPGFIDEMFMYALIVEKYGKLYITHYWRDELTPRLSYEITKTSHSNWKIYSPAMRAKD